jgi:hypothetical protein
MTSDMISSNAVAPEAARSNTGASSAVPAPLAPDRPGRAPSGGANRAPLFSPTAGLRLLWAVIRFVLVSCVFVFGKFGKSRRR